MADDYPSAILHEKTTVATAEGQKPPEAADGQRVRDFLAMAKRRWKLSSDAETEERKESLDDLKFLTGDQWPDNIKAARARQNKPCMTINRLPSIKSQIVNEQRAQRPGITVNPVGSDSDVETAKIWQGIIRHIDVNSDAELADDNAFEQMVTGGKGYEELVTDYLPGFTFDQEIYVKPVKNRFTVYCDPSSVDACETDANWKFQVEDIPHEEYRLRFEDSELASMLDFKSIGDQNPDWADSETVRVAKYWFKDQKNTKLLKLSDGSSILEGEPNPYNLPVISERPYIKTTIICSLINAIEILNETPEEWRGAVWPGKVGYIPLIPCIAEDFDVNGKRKVYGFVRHSKDAQRAFNYWKTAATEMIALASKAPWIGWKGQFKDSKWANSNTIDYAYLEADTMGLKGEQFSTLPQRNVAEPPIQAMTVMTMGADQDLKSTTGIYEPTLGQGQQHESGKKVDLLQKQSALGQLNYTDNLSRMLRHRARIIMDVAPKIYDAPRVQRILKPDGTASHVVVHAGRDKAADAHAQENEIDVSKVYDLSVGTYDVVISVGPSYQTKRQEAVAAQLQLAQADPEILKIAGDILVGNMDFPGAEEMAARIKKTIPPNLIDDDGTDPQVALQKAQAQMQQMKQVNTELMQHNAQMMDDLKSKKIETDARTEQVRMQTETQLTIAEINKSTTIGLEQIRASIGAYQLMQQNAHELGLQAHSQTHEADQAQKTQDAAAASQTQAEEAQAGDANAG